MAVTIVVTFTIGVLALFAAANMPKRPLPPMTDHPDGLRILREREEIIKAYNIEQAARQVEFDKAKSAAKAEEEKREFEARVAAKLSRKLETERLNAEVQARYDKAKGIEVDPIYAEGYDSLRSIGVTATNAKRMLAVAKASGKKYANTIDLIQDLYNKPKTTTP